MRISLHHLTLQDASLLELAEVAAAVGYGSICLFVKVPNDLDNFPRVGSVQEGAELRKRLTDLGLTVHNTDTGMITPGVDIAVYDESLEIAAALGARTFNIVSLEKDLNAAAGKLTTLAEMAEKVGVKPIFEWFRRSAVRTVGDSLDIVGRTGRSDIGLNIDILHLIRNGELPADLEKIPQRMKGYGQINDGPLFQVNEKQGKEAVEDRDFPGAGDFPLVDFVRQFPEDSTISVEAPVMRLAKRMSALERAQRHFEGAQTVLRAAGRSID